MTAKTPFILVVDDEVDTCRSLSDILTDLGYRVDVAHDGLTALELVRQKPYEVALLDLKMPGLHGIEVLREIKKTRPKIQVIILTGHGTEQDEDGDEGRLRPIGLDSVSVNSVLSVTPW